MFYNFNQSFIYWEPIKNHLKYKNEIVPTILNNVHRLNKHVAYNNCYMSWGSDVKIDYEEIIRDGILPALDNMIEELNLNVPSSYHIEDIWTNYYKDGGEQFLHTHEKTDISGVYLLYLQELNTTHFYSFCDCSLTDDMRSTDDIEEGNIILFPSHLPHEVRRSTKDRITISFDIKCNIDNLLLSTLDFKTDPTTTANNNTDSYGDGTQRQTIEIQRGIESDELLPKAFWDKTIH